MNPPYGGNEKSDVKSHFPSDMRSSETADLFMVLIMYRLKKNGRAAVIVPDGFLFGADNTKIAIKTKLLRDFNLHTIIRLPGSIFCTLHFDCHEHFVLRQYQCGGCSRRLFYKGNVVLSFGYARGLQAFLQDKVHEVGTLRPNP